MLPPAYKITIGNQVVNAFERPSMSPLMDLTVSLHMNIPANSFKLTLANAHRFKPRAEEKTTISLGYTDENELVQVMQGNVEVVETKMSENHIIGFSAATALLRRFSKKTFVDQTAGEIVQTLAKQAGIATQNIEPGVELPHYKIDNHRNFYRQMRDLAKLSNYDFYINNANKIVFQPFNGGSTVHLFEYTQHLLELEVTLSRPQANQGQNATVVEESWSWLSTDFEAEKSNSCTGGPTLFIHRHTPRNHRSKQTTPHTTICTDQNRGKINGQLLSIGRPHVRLGDSIHLHGAPNSELNQLYQVRAVTHRMNIIGGFTTHIAFRSLD